MKSQVIILGLAIVFFSTGYAVAEEKEPAGTEATEGAVSQAKEDVPTYCPICGPEEEMHGLALGYKYKGKKYSFCSMECLRAFKKDPEKFLNETYSPDEEEHGHEGQGH